MPFQMISGLVNSGVNLATGIMNYRAQQDTNAQNERLLRESWARDDKAFSRAYDDITSKGFSPLAALGQSFGNTNPMSLESPQLNFGSGLEPFTNAVGSAADRYLAKKQQAVADKIADSQIKNVDADTRDKNASADVNEATSAVQILKAKVELDNMIRDGQMSTSQIVGYLNDLKSQGVSDSVIDSLLASFEPESQNPAAYLSSSSLSGNTLTNATISKLKSDKALTDDYHSLQSTIASEYNMQSNKDLRSSLGEAQKLAAEYEAKLKELDYNNQNALWTVDVPVNITDDGSVVTKSITGKPYEVVNKFNLFFKKYEKSFDARDIRVNPTESGPVKSIKSFLELFKGWL